MRGARGDSTLDIWRAAVLVAAGAAGAKAVVEEMPAPMARATAEMLNLAMVDLLLLKKMK